MQRARTTASATRIESKTKRTRTANGASAAARPVRAVAPQAPAAPLKTKSPSKPPPSGVKSSVAKPAERVAKTSSPPPPPSKSVPPPSMKAPATIPPAAKPAVIPSPPESANDVMAVPPPPPVTFTVGQKAVHPSHGVGEVTAIEERQIGGMNGTFYVLRILDKGMRVMVPTSATSQVGLRAIMSEAEADGILATMRAREVAVDVQPWSRRFRIYTEMINSGSPTEIAKVLRDMNRLKFDKDLSFGERRLLDQAKSLLMKELAFAKQKSEADMAKEIQEIFTV